MKRPELTIGLTCALGLCILVPLACVWVIWAAGIHYGPYYIQDVPRLVLDGLFH